MSFHPEQIKWIKELDSGISSFDNNNLNCGQSYGVFKFHPEVGAYNACCDAPLINYDHEKFTNLGKDYFDKHPTLLQRKNDLINNIKTSTCIACWKKEEQGIQSMRTALAPTESREVHQNPYLDVEKSYPNRIELWMNSTCNLGCFMCHTGNSNTLRKIWYEDYDTYGFDGRGHEVWIEKSDFKKYNMHSQFLANMENWILDHISNPLNKAITIAYLGGEPTLHNEMFEHADKFINAAKVAFEKNSKCERSISIVTNGTSKDRLNERFYNMYKKYKEAGWITKIMLSNDGVDEASQVRHGADSVQIMRNCEKWMEPDNVIDDVTHFTVLTNLSFPYVHKLAYKLKDIVDKHFKGRDDIALYNYLEKQAFANEIPLETLDFSQYTQKGIDFKFNPCIAPDWLQIKYLPKKFAEYPAQETLKVFDYLNETYPKFLTTELAIFKSVRDRMEESPPQKDVEHYFERLHYVQSVYRKSYPNWDFYKNFPHLIEFGNDYGIERE